MNRIDACFQKKNKNVLSVYFTAGFPALNDTTGIIKALDKHGADMIEIGIPFSDPVADGPVIQASSKSALENGITLNVLFEQLKDLRKITNMPVILMGYMNPVFKMGWDLFLEKCHVTGVDGVIIPDFPPEEYEISLLDRFRKYNIYNILLVTPQTPAERIKYLDQLSRGFIYMVSSYSTTGVQNGFGVEQTDYFKRIERMNLKNPRMIGFGISDQETFQTACRYAQGGIIGTGFIRMLNEAKNIDENVGEFLRNIRGLI